MSKSARLRAAVYVRVSRLDQHTENQLRELRRYAKARGWQTQEFIENGVSGARVTGRPQLDAMMTAVHRRDFDLVLVWKLDRLGRDLQHLVTLLNQWRDLKVGFVSMAEGIDTTTSAGRMIFGVLATLAEFERERLRERTLLGLDRARAQGTTLGRPHNTTLRRRLPDVAHLSVREAAKVLGCSPVTVQKLRKPAP